jgi:hypothetical protein
LTGVGVLNYINEDWWSEFLAIDPEVPGSIPDATTFSEK